MMRSNPRKLARGLVLVMVLAVASVPAAAVFFTDIDPLGTWSVGTQSFEYGGHITWAAAMDGEGNETFRTVNHGTDTCGWPSCTGAGTPAQAHCIRTAGLGTYGDAHQLESLLIKNGVVVSRAFHEHVHPSDDHNVANALAQALFNISVCPAGTVTWQFKVKWYNSNGDAEEGMTETLL